MKHAIFITAWLLAVPATVLAAHFTDCRSLSELCQDGLKYASSAQACKQYITGSVDQLLESGNDRVCLDKKPSLNAIQEAVTKWLAGHPQQQHLSASSCVIIALSDAFPCGRK